MTWKELPRNKPGKLGGLDRIRGYKNERRAIRQRMAPNVRLPAACDEDRRVALAFKVNATPTYCYWTFEEASLVHRGGGRLYAVYTAL